MSPISSLCEVVTDILVTKFGAERSHLHPDTRFQDLDFDSLNVVELSLALGARLDMEVDEEDISRQVTLGDLVKMLEARSITG